MTKTLIIGHDLKPNTPCVDGLVARWIAKRAIPDADMKGWCYANVNDDTGKFVLVGDVDVEFNKVMRAIAGYDHIVIVDFSFPRYVLEAIQAQGKTFVVLDHHKTPMQRIGDVSYFSDQIIKLDKNRSGAGLTWRHYFPNEPVPAFVEMVEHRDIWTWKNTPNREEHRYFGSTLSTLRFSAKLAGLDEFAIIDLIANMSMEQLLAFVRPIGKSLVEKDDLVVNGLLTRVTKAELLGHRIPLVILDPEGSEDRYRSDVGHALCERFPKAGFSAILTSSGLQLRSLYEDNLGIDVEEIATKLGGGGHPGASGCSITVEQFGDMVTEFSSDWHLDDLK